MKRKASKRLGFKIDKLTSSIENKLTGETFETEIARMGNKDLRLIESSEWEFDWKSEISENDRKVYKLTTKENPDIIQGLVSLEDREDHFFMHLLESAGFNRNSSKLYQGVPGNLVAFGCKLSFEKGYHGFLVFKAKSKLIEHYEKTLLAKRFAGNRMFIGTEAAYILVRKYFKDFDNEEK